jgi:hypothetical protein
MFKAKRRMPAYKDSFNLSVSSNGPTAVNFNFAVQNVVLQIQPTPSRGTAVAIGAD